MRELPERNSGRLVRRERRLPAREPRFGVLLDLRLGARRSDCPRSALVERQPHRAAVAVQLDEPSAESELLVSSVAGVLQLGDALAELLLRGLDQAEQIDLRVCAFRYRRSCRLVDASAPALRVS